MKEYTIKIKDLDQDITHTINQIAYSKTEANSIVLRYLRKALGTDNFEVL